MLLRQGLPVPGRLPRDASARRAAGAARRGGDEIGSDGCGVAGDGRRGEQSLGPDRLAAQAPRAGARRRRLDRDRSARRLPLRRATVEALRRRVRRRQARRSPARRSPCCPSPTSATTPSQQYFADGLAEDIITRLARLRWLFVAARTSSFTYGGKPVDVQQVGRDLGVRYVLDGSVRRSGQRLRIGAELSDADDRPAGVGRSLRRRRGGLLRPAGPDRRERHRRDRAAALRRRAPARPEPVAGHARRLGLRHAGDALRLHLGPGRGDRGRRGAVAAGARDRSRVSARQQPAGLVAGGARPARVGRRAASCSRRRARRRSGRSGAIPRIPGRTSPRDTFTWPREAPTRRSRS